MRTKRTIISILLFVFSAVCCFLALNWQPSQSDRFKGVYGGEFVAYAASDESAGATTSATGGVRAMVSVSRDYLLLATALTADTSLYSQIGYLISADGAEAVEYTSDTYYTSISVQTKSGSRKTYSIADIFGTNENITGIIVEEIVYSPLAAYTIQPFVTDNEGVRTLSSSVEKDPMRTLLSLTATSPDKTEYTAGETFDPTGMVVTANYNVAPYTETVSDYTYSTEPLAFEDGGSFPVSWNGKTAVVPISVNWELVAGWEGSAKPSASSSQSFFLSKDGVEGLGTYSMGQYYCSSFKVGAKMRFYYNSAALATATLSFRAASGNPILTYKHLGFNLYYLNAATDDIAALTPTAIPVSETSTFGVASGWTDFSAKYEVGEITLQAGWNVIEVYVPETKQADLNFKSVVLNRIEYHYDDLQHVAAQDATCERDGNIEYWYSAAYDHYFADAAATVRIAQKDTVIAGGHVLVDEWKFVPPTKTTYTVGETIDTTGMSLTATCSRCGTVDATAEVTLNHTVAPQADAYCTVTITATYGENVFAFDVLVYSAKDSVNSCYVGWETPAFLGGATHTESYFVKTDTVNGNSDPNNDLYQKMNYSADGTKVSNVNNGDVLRFYFYAKQATTAKLAFASSTANAAKFKDHFNVTLATADETEKPSNFQPVTIADDAMIGGGWASSEAVVADVDLVAGWNVVTVECTSAANHNFYYATLYLN